MTLRIVARAGQRVKVSPVTILCPGCKRTFKGVWGRTDRRWAKHYTKTHLVSAHLPAPQTQEAS